MCFDVKKFSEKCEFNFTASWIGLFSLNLTKIGVARNLYLSKCCFVGFWRIISHNIPLRTSPGLLPLLI
jgi:hypothetical protein